jgi:GrpB-like predicted nucleotidyltransferase (UPF0157 family)
MKVTLVPYNPEWKTMFESERGRLSEALREFSPGIEHIGSTSIEGLGAKPVIDIQIGVHKKEHLDMAVPLIINLRYIYCKKYEDELPFRRYFFDVENPGNEELPKVLYTHNDRISREDFPHIHHIHMVEYNSDWWKRHIAFRDYLRKNNEARDAYYIVKAELAQKDWKTVNDYADAKTEFVRRIERRAGILN